MWIKEGQHAGRKKKKTVIKTDIFLGTYCMEIFSNCLFKLIRFSAVAFCNYSILNTDVKWHSWVNSVEWRKLFKSGILNHLYCCVGLP